MIKLFIIPFIELSKLRRKHTHLEVDDCAISKKIKKGSLIVFFLLLVIESRGDQLCPNSRLLGGCSIVSGCIYNSLNGNLVTCGDDSHYYVASGDFDWLGRENFLILTLPLDDYFFFLGALFTVYVGLRLNSKLAVLK